MNWHISMMTNTTLELFDLLLEDLGELQLFGWFPADAVDANSYDDEEKQACRHTSDYHI